MCHFSLIAENDTTGTKWIWVQTKIGGIRFSSRCGMSITAAANNSAYCFGGVFDEEDDDEDLCGNFFNDFYSLDLEKLVWRSITLVDKKDTKVKPTRRRNKDEDRKGERNSIYGILFLFYY